MTCVIVETQCAERALKLVLILWVGRSTSACYEFMERNNSWEDNIFSASQKIPCVLRIPKVNNRFYDSQALLPILILVFGILLCIHRVSQEERSVFCEVIVSVILRKKFI
jgi:hypothetical protein